MPGQTTVVENYVFDGDQLVAVMNATGAIQHEYFDGNSLDQVFADQTVLSGVLWPLEDRTGAARDVISTAGVVLDHRTLDSFGNISSRSGAWIDYDQFFSGLFYDADSQLYYARARWYDATSGKFIGEDPLRFGAGDVNLSRYSANDPVNRVDRNGMFSLKNDILRPLSRAAEVVGDFFEDNWENGNIQKGLLVAGTIASGGVLAMGGLGGMALLAESLTFASGAVNSYETFSGNTIGDGTFSRVLSATASITTGAFGRLGTNSGSLGRSASFASGLASGYEIASGNTIGDGTFSSVLHVTNLGINHGSAFVDPNTTAFARFGLGLNIAAGVASVASAGNPRLQQSLRALSISTHVWNAGQGVYVAVATAQAAVMAARASRAAVQQASGGGMYSIPPEELSSSSDIQLRPIYQLTDPDAVFTNEGPATSDFERALRGLQERQFRDKVTKAAGSVDYWLAERRSKQVLYQHDDGYYQELVRASKTHDSYIAEFRALTGQDYTGNLKDWTPPYVPTFSSAFGDQLFGEESRTNPESFAAGYRRYLTNPDDMDMDLRIGFYGSATIGVSAGTLATGGTLFGAGSLSSVSMYGGGMVFAGGVAGGIDGGLNAYAGGSTSYGGISFGVGSGVIGGVLNPISGFTSFGGGVVGGGIEYASGGKFLGNGYQYGSFGGGLFGGGLDDIYKGANYIHALKQTAVLGGVSGTAAAGTYWYTGDNVDAALMVGNFAQIPGGMLARGLVTCFPAGTPILTPNGSVPIEQLQPGDMVLSRDQHDINGDVSAKAIDKVFVREGELWDLRVNGQSIRITADHPLFVEGKGWIPAGEVVAGDRLASISQLVAAHTHGEFNETAFGNDQSTAWESEWLEVESCHSTGELTTVFNFRVTNWHTYFVATNDDDAIWVHNAEYDEAMQGLTRGNFSDLYQSRFKGEYGEQLSVGIRSDSVPIGFQVPVATHSGKVTIFDSVELNRNSGMLHFVESKYGPTAALNANQRLVHRTLQQSGGIILPNHRYAPDMIVAWGEGIVPGPIAPSQFRIFTDKFTQKVPEWYQQ